MVIANAVVHLLATELSNYRHTVRSTAKRAIELMAAARGCSTTEILAPCRGAVEAHIFSKQLRAVQVCLAELGEVDFSLDEVRLDWGFSFVEEAIAKGRKDRGGSGGEDFPPSWELRIEKSEVFSRVFENCRTETRARCCCKLVPHPQRLPPLVNPSPKL